MKQRDESMDAAAERLRLSYKTIQPKIDEANAEHDPLKALAYTVALQEDQIIYLLEGQKDLMRRFNEMVDALDELQRRP